MNKIDIEDFVRGTTFMGTGGGGSPRIGERRLLDVLDDNKVIEWVEPDSIPDDSWICSVFGMGSIAPTNAHRGAFNLFEKVDSSPMVRAVQELERLAGVKIDAVVPFELGGNNTAIAVKAAAMLGLRIPDGDFSGRAIPELAQARPAICGLSVTPLVICDEWGNIIHVINSPNNIAAEGIGKMISIVTKAPDMSTLCAHAGFLMTGKEMKKYLVRNTLSKCLKLGRAIRQARENGGNVLEAAANEAGGIVLFKGKVTNRKFVSEGGYMIGNSIVEGSEEYNGQQFKIWYKNENHLAWRNEKIIAMSPDLIEIVDKDKAEPITNTDLTEGNEVGVIGIPNPTYRNNEGIKMMGPKYYGFDYEYIPVEELGR